MSDHDGWKRGAKGIDGRKGEDFAKPDFDVKRQRGPRYVGIDNTVMQDSAQLEGDNVA